jgi:SAM-dependent methyltransferase
MCEHLGLDDFSATDVLDVGCGVKMSSTLINEDVPMQRYVGIDVYGEMIDFLRDNVRDPRFAYHHVDLHNDLYNPQGERLTPATRLPVPEAGFDVIWLFSVFTHFVPDDFTAMLQVLRRHIRPSGRLFFSLYVNEETPGGHGFVDALAKLLRERPELMEGRRTPADEQSTPDFCDFSPTHPLRTALYSRAYATELVEGAGWEPLKLLDPGPYVQHSFVCAPR